MVATSTLAAYVSFSDLGTTIIAGLNYQQHRRGLLPAPSWWPSWPRLVAFGLGLLQRALTPEPLRRPRRDGPRPGVPPPHGLANADLFGHGFRSVDSPVASWQNYRIRAHPPGGKAQPCESPDSYSPASPSPRLYLFGIAAALSAAAGASTPTITIGSTNFEEQAIVSNLYGDVLTHAGYTVKVEPALGTRAVVVPAMEQGQLDLEPDYAASLLGYLNGGTPEAAGNKITTGRPAATRSSGRLGAHGPARRRRSTPTSSS